MSAHPAIYFPSALCFSCDFSVLAAGVRNAFCSFHSRKCARQFGSWKFWKIPPQKTNCLDLWKCCYWWQFWFWEYVVSPSLSCSHDRTIKVEKNLKASLDLIPSPSPWKFKLWAGKFVECWHHQAMFCLIPSSKFFRQ